MATSKSRFIVLIRDTRLAALLVFVAAIAGAAFAQANPQANYQANSQAKTKTAAHPDLNGTWVLNAARSDFGQAPPPSQQIEDILQAGSEVAISISLEREQIKQHYTLRFAIGGEAMPAPAGAFPSDAPFRILSVRGDWDGAALVTTEKVSFKGEDGTIVSRYTLSAGGKVLTKATHIAMSEGEFDTRTVYDKQ